ncbi:MAG TPA: GNAT family N-acetyltransferase [Candidatus Limnocylindria bacterium]|nr:GNAT family N-acetyltransferase [Candidatus Limnocylindria bacterium]
MSEARIRPARPADAGAVAELSGQLGYPVDANEQARRLAPVLASERDAVLVAVDVADRPIGWIHVQERMLLEASGQALVAGLVVDAAHRSDGIGRALLAAGEAWARERGLATMRVLSRVERERAHRFYQREGYRIIKRSLNFEKPL